MPVFNQPKLPLVKVICINAIDPTYKDIKPKWILTEGDIYIVDCVKEIFGRRYYGLKERGKSGRECLYKADRFLPLSNLDETKIYFENQCSKNQN